MLMDLLNLCAWIFILSIIAWVIIGFIRALAFFTWQLISIPLILAMAVLRKVRTMFPSHTPLSRS